MMKCFKSVETLQLNKKPFSASCSFDRVKKSKKLLFCNNITPHTPKTLQLNITFGEDVNWVNSLFAAYILNTINPSRWALSTPVVQMQMPSSYLNLDPMLNNRLWSGSQVFLLLRGAFEAFSYKAAALHLSLHSTWTAETGLPAYGYSLCFPVCNSFCCGLQGSRRFTQSHRGTRGDSEEEKFCSSFPCEENEPRKITTRNCFM